MKDFLKEEYSTIIQTTINRSPENYEVIDFKKFLAKEFSSVNEFINIDVVKNIRSRIMVKYNNDKSCFSDFGILKEISFSELHYYQNEIGITGPKFSDINDPVAIINIDNKYILWNGYHRTLLKMAKKEPSINGYVLNISNSN